MTEDAANDSSKDEQDESQPRAESDRGLRSEDCPDLAVDRTELQHRLHSTLSVQLSRIDHNRAGFYEPRLVGLDESRRAVMQDCVLGPDGERT